MIRLEEWASLSPAAVGGMHNLLGVYKPYINYSWSSTYQAQEYKTDGVELVTNGDFSDGLTSYDLDVDGGTPSIVDERLYIVSNGDGFTGIKQPGLPLVNTDVLKVEVSLEIITGTEIRIQLGSDVLIVPAPDGISTYYSSGFAGTPRISVLTTGIDEFYVNYVSVQKVIQEPNNMYSKNLGTGTPLALYSGQGAKFNGVDQNTVANNLYVNTQYMTFLATFKIEDVSTHNYIFQQSVYNQAASIKIEIRNTKEIRIDFGGSGNRVVIPQSSSGVMVGEVYDLVSSFDSGVVTTFINGVLIDTTTLGTSTITTSTTDLLYLGSDFGGSTYFGGTLKDLFIFNRALTQAEITKYSTNPNQFFNDARLDNTCVLNMPLSENDKYCIDYANYSEALLIEDDFSLDLSKWTELGTPTIIDGVCHCDSTTINTGIQYAGAITSELYLIEFDLEIINGTMKVDMGGSTNLFTASGRKTVILKQGATNTLISFYRVTSGDIFNLDNISIKQLSGVHEISNYTDSVRDEAKQLPYGSQNANYKINNLGMRTDESPYFEGSELFDNYGDTGWIPSATDDWSIELIMDFKGDGTNRWQGWNGDLHIGERTNTPLTPRVEVYGDSTAYIIAPTQVTVGFHMMTIVKSGDNYALFVDGVLSATGTTTNPVFANSLFLGGHRDDIFINVIDRLFKVHPKALTQEEITAAYQNAVKQGLLT